MTNQTDRIAKLEAAYAKVMGVLGVYMTCEQMVKGEAYRDLEATWRHLEGTTPPDADRGWPACFAREAEGRAKAEAELARLRPLAEPRETPRYWASSSQKAYAVIRDEWGVGMHVLGHEPRQSCMEARDFYVQHQTDIDPKDWFIQCITEAEARRLAGFPEKTP
jgi:hypothetical protein